MTAPSLPLAGTPLFLPHLRLPDERERFRAPGRISGRGRVRSRFLHRGGRRGRRQHLLGPGQVGGETLFASRPPADAQETAAASSSESPAASPSSGRTGFPDRSRASISSSDSISIHRIAEIVAESRDRKDDRRVPVAAAGRGSDRDPRPGERRERIRHDHGGVRQFLRLLRRAVHPRPGEIPARRRRSSTKSGTWPPGATGKSSFSGRTSTITSTRTRARISPPFSAGSRQIDGPEWIRFITSHPEEFPPGPGPGDGRDAENLPAAPPPGPVRVERRPGTDEARDTPGRTTSKPSGRSGR